MVTEPLTFLLREARKTTMPSHAKERDPGYTGENFDDTCYIHMEPPGEYSFQIPD